MVLSSSSLYGLQAATKDLRAQADHTLTTCRKLHGDLFQGAIEPEQLRITTRDLKNRFIRRLEIDYRGVVDDCIDFIGQRTLGEKLNSRTELSSEEEDWSESISGPEGREWEDSDLSEGIKTLIGPRKEGPYNYNKECEALYFLHDLLDLLSDLNREISLRWKSDSRVLLRPFQSLNDMRNKVKFLIEDQLRFLRRYQEYALGLKEFCDDLVKKAMNLGIKLHDAKI